MARMSEINVQKSKYFKIVDLEKITGKPWGKSNAVVTIERAWVDEYPAEDGKEPEPAYLLAFAGIEKPLGCNLTNRKTLEGIVGDVEWDTAALAGVKLQVYAEYTSMGPGIRIRFHQDGATDTTGGDDTEPPTEEIPGDPVTDQEPPF